MGLGAQVRCKIPDIHAVIDRAVAGIDYVSAKQPGPPEVAVVSGDVVTVNHWDSLGNA